MLTWWQWFLVGLGFLALLLTAVYVAVSIWAKKAYERMLRNPKTCCDIDAFVGPNNPVAATRVALMTKFSVGSRQASTDPIPLEVYKSPHVPGLWVTRKLQQPPEQTDPFTSTVNDDVMSLEELLQASPKESCPIVVATIRMGFGHHRLAYSTCSWAMKTNRTVIFHDLLSINSPEADLIKSTDELYSKFSRYASEMGGLVEKLWGSAMLSGDANALRMAALTAAHLQPLLLALPKDTPLITTHQTVALTASACGFTNVINLVVDNHPQWFLTVPNALNLVQGPVNYQSFLQMGISAEELAWAGHWCPYDLVANIEKDCGHRMEHVQSSPRTRPLRLLIPVGGAGAQRKFILGLLQALAPLVQQKKVQLLLNAGDHVHMRTAFLQVLDESGLDFDVIGDSAGVMEFQQKFLLENVNADIPKGVTLFSFEEYFPAVATTDLLCRVADVLCCKPSELAFYCIPKLHIRRVGDHEADSAKRSSEVGDGTVEARELQDAIRFCDLFETTDLLKVMNQAIIDNNRIGIYNGCKNAVDFSLERAAAAPAKSQ